MQNFLKSPHFHEGSSVISIYLLYPITFLLFYTFALHPAFSIATFADSE